MTDKPDPVAALQAGVRRYAESTDASTARQALIAGAHQYLADLDDESFAALITEVRPPRTDNTTEAPEFSYPPHWTPRPRTTD